MSAIFMTRPSMSVSVVFGVAWTSDTKSARSPRMNAGDPGTRWVTTRQRRSPQGAKYLSGFEKNWYTESSCPVDEC